MPMSSFAQTIATATQQRRPPQENGSRPEETASGFALPLEFPLPLPATILVDVLAHSLRRPPVCALSLLCPEWSLCPRHRYRSRRSRRSRALLLRAILRTVRVDTYTLPDGPEMRGRIETSFDHDHDHDHDHDPAAAAAAAAAKCGSSKGGDCILLDVMQDPREVFVGGGGSGGSFLPRELLRDLVRWWAGRSVMVVSQRREPPVLGPLWARDLQKRVEEETDDDDDDGGGGDGSGSGGGERRGGRGERERGEGVVILREERAVSLVPYKDDFVIEVGGWGGEEEGKKGAAVRKMVFGVNWSEKDALPASNGDAESERPVYAFERIRHLVVNSVPALAGIEAEDLGMMPATRCPQTQRNLEYLEERLEHERGAHLRIRWDAMERLETLCLDLRGYSMPEHSYLWVEDVFQLAQSLRGKRLKLLVIAGLRSFGYYSGFDPERIEDVEGGTWDPVLGAWMSKKKGVGINWWKMFEGTVRPGGRLVFVDKSNEDGLLPPGVE